MLKPQNIIQAAAADLRRKQRNAEQAKHRDHSYEPYAFHRTHVRRAISAHELVLLALMDGPVADKTAKENTRMIYGNARLLVDAMRITSPS